MKIYYWEDEDGNAYYYSQKQKAIAHLRQLLNDGETATAVMDIQQGDAVELLTTLQETITRLERRIQKIKAAQD